MTSKINIIKKEASSYSVNTENKSELMGLFEYQLKAFNSGEMALIKAIFKPSDVLKLKHI